MAELCLHRMFFDSYQKLALSARKKIPDFVEKFQADPQHESLDFKKPNGMSDSKVRSARIDQKYRAIIISPPKGEERYLLVHVDNHDEAYRWAENKSFDIHRESGVLQIVDGPVIQQVTEDIQTAKGDSAGLFSAFSEDDIYMAGVPRELIPAVLAVSDEEQLNGLLEYLPEECTSILKAMANGESLDEALKIAIESGERPTEVPDEVVENFSNVEKYNSSIHFFGTEELKRALALPLDKWRVYLHPSQTKLIEKDHSGPMLVTGSAGTGKTVVLMHRARRLAETNPSRKIVVITFTVNLSLNIKKLLKTLYPESDQQIEVINLYALARTFCRRSGWDGSITSEADLKANWESVLKEVELSVWEDSPEEYRREYEEVIEPKSIHSEASYVSAIRTGRPKLSRKDRKAVHAVFEAFEERLKNRNQLTPELSIFHARRYLEQNENERYDHVLIDEVQDFSLEGLNLANCLSKEGTENGLFLTGDNQQRVYKGNTPLSRAGIQVRGRSHRLRLNYRTTEQIRTTAHGFIAGLPIDSLDETEIDLRGERSLFTGSKPVVQLVKDDQEEANFIVDTIIKMQEADATLDLRDICVCPRKRATMDLLESKGLGYYEIDPLLGDDRDRPGVRTAGSARVKGLEFRIMFIAGESERHPVNDLEGATRFERCAIYVAASRAREQLFVVKKG